MGAKVSPITGSGEQGLFSRVVPIDALSSLQSGSIDTGNLSTSFSQCSIISFHRLLTMSNPRRPLNNFDAGLVFDASLVVL